MRTRTRKREMPEASINITSLLDITFVLLISFMVVAPSVRYEVGLTLPKVSQTTKPSKDAKQVTLQIKQAADGSGAFYVNGKEADLADVPAMLNEAMEPENASKTVTLEADRAVPWEIVADAVSTLKANDINEISIITEERKR